MVGRHGLTDRASASYPSSQYRGMGIESPWRIYNLFNYLYVQNMIVIKLWKDRAAELYALMKHV